MMAHPTFGCFVSLTMSVRTLLSQVWGWAYARGVLDPP